MRLLREVLPPHPEIPRRYDVLIVDEVHNCAPAGAGGRYAKDTLRTQAIRTLAPHCEHRLFLPTGLLGTRRSQTFSSPSHSR